MDSVRFGRALGTGARLAAKTLVTAADAATSPNPAASRQPRTTAATARRVGNAAVRTTEEVRGTTRGIARGTRRFGEAAWGPFVRLSGVLWLELTGVFFGLFALSAALGAWKLRGNFHRTATNGDAHAHLALAAGIALLFGYFCFSSFIRANRRERRR